MLALLHYTVLIYYYNCKFDVYLQKNVIFATNTYMPRLLQYVRKIPNLLKLVSFQNRHEFGMYKLNNAPRKKHLYKSEARAVSYVLGALLLMDKVFL